MSKKSKSYIMPTYGERDLVFSKGKGCYLYAPSGKKYLDAQRIKLDKRLLNNFYLNRGYYDTKIESSSAKYLDNNKFELNFTIHSGKKYFFNPFDLILPDNYNEKNFKPILSIFDEIKNTPYSLSKIELILDEIDIYANPENITKYRGKKLV